MLKNDIEGNSKIKFHAENRKEWKFYILIIIFWEYIRNILVGSFFEFFAVLKINFLKEPIFAQKTTQKLKFK
jgi:hypothetical protein